MLENLGQKIANGVNEAKNKTEILGLKGKISSAKKERDALFTLIGEKCYAACKDEVPEYLKDLFEQTSAIDETIKGFESQIRDLSGIVVCPNCGAELSKESKFCTVCGTKLPEIEKPAPEPQEGVCPVCGAKVDPEATFCFMCGTRLIPEEAPAEEETAPAEEQGPTEE